VFSRLPCLALRRIPSACGSGSQFGTLISPDRALFVLNPPMGRTRKLPLLDDISITAQFADVQDFKKFYHRRNSTAAANP
jgi:hypothetical protein